LANDDHGVTLDVVEEKFNVKTSAQATKVKLKCNNPSVET
jgi:hypothetical protein